MDERNAILAIRLAENTEAEVSLEREHARMLEASLDSNADDEHDPEGATIAFEREQLTAALVRTARPDPAFWRPWPNLRPGVTGSATPAENRLRWNDCRRCR